MDNTLKIGCVVMAAGNAARFGENKLAAMVNGKPLIEHALEAIPRESFSRVLVVTQHENVEAAAKKFGFETLRNEHPERGQSETIRLGTAALSDCDALCFMVADQPMLKRKTVAQELKFFRAHSENIVGLGHNGVRGNPCIFPRRFFPELMALTGDVGGNVVIRAHPESLLLYETAAAELRDVDTVEALAAIRTEKIM